MNFDPDKSMAEALAKDDQFKEFFSQSKAIIRNFDIKKNPQKWIQVDFDLDSKLREAKEKIHHHLCNNVDTASVIHELGSLIVETNKYLKNEETQVKSSLIVSISQYILKISKCLGLVENDPFRYTSVSEETDPETLVAPYVQVAVAFRDQVKQLAGQDKKLLIEQCDKVRDEHLAQLGIRLEDTGMATPSVWMKEDPETLLKSIADKKAAKEKKEKDKEEAKIIEDKKKSCPPSEWYKTFETDAFSKFDESGIPTHDVDGKELTKEKVNGLKKQMKAKDKKYAKYLEKLEQEEKKRAEQSAQ
jgi:cysteinyl-tRNA synthetase